MVYTNNVLGKFMIGAFELKIGSSSSLQLCLSLDYIIIVNDYWWIITKKKSGKMLLALLSGLVSHPECNSTNVSSLFY